MHSDVTYTRDKNDADRLAFPEATVETVTASREPSRSRCGPKAGLATRGFTGHEHVIT